LPLDSWSGLRVKAGIYKGFGLGAGRRPDAYGTNIDAQYPLRSRIRRQNPDGAGLCVPKTLSNPIGQAFQ
jgi:hypothetical protein